MAYEMKGNKKPGSSYKDQMAFADKGLYGPTDDGAHDGPGDDKSTDKGIEDRFTDKQVDRKMKRWDKKAERNKKITRNVDEAGNVSYTKEVAGGAQRKNISFDKSGKHVKRSEYRGLDAAAKRGNLGAIAHKLAGGQDIHDEISHEMGKIGGSGIQRLKERFTGPKEDRKFWKGVHKDDRISKRGGIPGTNIAKQKEVKHGKYKGELKTVYKGTDVGRMVTFTDSQGNVTGTRGDKKGKSRRKTKRINKKIS